jgi:hypothetical protein
MPGTARLRPKGEIALIFGLLLFAVPMMWLSHR